MADFHLIGDHDALFVANSVDSRDGEVAAVQFRQRLLQSSVEIVLQRQFCRRRQDARVHAVGLAVSFLRQQLHLAGRGGAAALRLIMEPISGREQRENQDEDYGEVVLPRAALVRPKKRLREDLSQAGHVSPRVRRRRSRRRAYAPRDRSTWWLPDYG